MNIIYRVWYSKCMYIVLYAVCIWRAGVPIIVYERLQYTNNKHQYTNYTLTKLTSIFCSVISSMGSDTYNTSYPFCLSLSRAGDLAAWVRVSPGVEKKEVEKEVEVRESVRSSGGVSGYR